jgi:hypothetical protein
VTWNQPRLKATSWKDIIHHIIIKSANPQTPNNLSTMIEIKCYHLVLGNAPLCLPGHAPILALGFSMSTDNQVAPTGYSSTIVSSAPRCEVDRSFSMYVFAVRLEWELRGLRTSVEKQEHRHYRKKTVFRRPRFLVWPPNIWIFSAVSLGHQKLNYFWKIKRFFPVGHQKY